MNPPTTLPAPPEQVTLAIEGMTCASCAARVEKRLNKIEGVAATVNYATEQARVTVPEGVGADDLIAQVEAAGYTAKLPKPRDAASGAAGAGASAAGASTDPEEDEADDRNGPTVRFAVEFPSPGDYRLFLDFAHGGEVRTAAFTVHVPAEGGAPTTTAPTTAPAPAADAGHAGH